MRTACWGILLAIVSGCGTDASIETAPVSGRVTLDGKPLEGVIVNFHFRSDTQEFVGSGRTDSDGKYTLATGAAVGENKVFIEERVDKKDSEFTGDEDSGMDAGQLDAANMDENEKKKEEDKSTKIPADYNEENSILKVIVAEGGTETADFALKADN